MDKQAERGDLTPKLSSIHIATTVNARTPEPRPTTPLHAPYPYRPRRSPQLSANHYVVAQAQAQAPGPDFEAVPKYANPPCTRHVVLDETSQDSSSDPSSFYLSSTSSPAITALPPPPSPNTTTTTPAFWFEQFASAFQNARRVPPPPPPTPPPVLVKTCEFADMPEQVQLTVLACLPVSSLCRSARVCRRWKRMVDGILISPDFWWQYQYIVALRREFTWFQKHPFNYFARHVALNSTNRAILVEWLFEVASDFRIGDLTAFTTVALLDGYLSLSRRQEPTNKFQLIGATCLFTAYKAVATYDSSIVNAEALSQISSSVFKREELIQSETNVLRTLEYDLLAPSSFSFLEMLMSLPSLQPCFEVKHLTELTLCYLELSALKFGLQGYKPSLLCVAAIVLAAETLGKPIWNNLEQFMPIYTEKEKQRIAACMSIMQGHILEMKDPPKKSRLRGSTVLKFVSIYRDPVLPFSVFRL